MYPVCSQEFIWAVTTHATSPAAPIVHQAVMQPSVKVRLTCCGFGTPGMLQLNTACKGTHSHRWLVLAAACAAGTVQLLQLVC